MEDKERKILEEYESAYGQGISEIVEVARLIRNKYAGEVSTNAARDMAREYVFFKHLLAKPKPAQRKRATKK